MSDNFTEIHSLIISFITDGFRKKMSQCGTDLSNSHVGSSANNVVAVYKVNQSLALAGTKLAPTTCRSYAHELFIPRFGIDLLNLQSDIGKPILKASCSYSHQR
jgi:hypothetical protein